MVRRARISRYSAISCADLDETQVFGADVSHASPGSLAPSVAALVGSLDAVRLALSHKLLDNKLNIVREQTCSIYGSAITIQPSRLEVVACMNEMVIKLLKQFEDKHGLLPERLITLRDGISEGQFPQVIATEVAAIRLACEHFGPDYKPALTFITCGKRHKISLFPKERVNADAKTGNVRSGVRYSPPIASAHANFRLTDDRRHGDRVALHLRLVSLDALPLLVRHSRWTRRLLRRYTQSHASLLGTGRRYSQFHAQSNRCGTDRRLRSSHYTVLLDDSGFSADQLQQLVFNLCFTYARATRAVSVATPAFYASRRASAISVFPARSSVPLPAWSYLTNSPAQSARARSSYSRGRTTTRRPSSRRRQARARSASARMHLPSTGAGSRLASFM